MPNATAKKATEPHESAKPSEYVLGTIAGGGGIIIVIVSVLYWRWTRQLNKRPSETEIPLPKFGDSRRNTTFYQKFGWATTPNNCEMFGQCDPAHQIGPASFEEDTFERAKAPAIPSLVYSGDFGTNITSIYYSSDSHAPSSHDCSQAPQGKSLFAISVGHTSYDLGNPHRSESCKTPSIEPRPPELAFQRRASSIYDFRPQS